MRTKVQFILLSGVLLLLCGCGAEKSNEEQPLVVYSVKASAIKPKSSKEFPFIAQPFRTSELSFRVGGPIDRLDVWAGAKYQRGSVIAEVDPRDFRIRKERAEALYHQSRAEFERIEALYGKGNISASTFERAKADCVAAKMAYEAAVNELADTRLMAPFTGYVGEVYIEKYQDVRASQPVLSLIDVHQLKIEIFVTQDVAVAAQSMDSIRLSFDVLPNRTFGARIAEVSKGTTENNLSYLLTAFLPNEDGELLAGMSGKATLVVSRNDGVARVCVPQAALCNRPTVGSYVWVVDEGRGEVHAQKVVVEELLPEGYAAISAGLQADEVVAVSKLRFLSEGMMVTTRAKAE